MSVSPRITGRLAAEWAAITLACLLLDLVILLAAGRRPGAFENVCWVLVAVAVGWAGSGGRRLLR
ncbi:hypothetical protein [Propionibacterium australiense]|uniref:Uncharacterized protein n=1 Tax=Propionibacterium australiense TaxID=119981 RepID=A0A383S715_9ACTN|nr:hypothetical protein [Propionibacterium australiense]RLP07041.1 hypothetical protein D7U36_11715 [Propionibacterium australiense]RLP07077.1 hypothetical protein D9T14_10735 [Propionibacterium australiense]SYZ33159.1 Hypothetical protein PROPAUS_1075 [Propionibacterium australiense]VEH89175.1 Uncharacterised protein [Propionibacterium australiense]